ncbi:MAG: hypothetical protein ACK5P7_03875 [Bdellovibrio sp.]|jgi:hypothetical protein
MQLSWRSPLLGGLLLFMSLTAAADWTGAKGLVALKSDSFVSPDYDVTASKQFGFFFAGMQTAGIGDPSRRGGMESLDSGLQAHIDGQFSPQAPILSYLNIRQLYHQEGFLSVGRKLENWSLLDERWGLGIYQPQFRWNPLRPESQGLTGIFARLTGDSEKLPWGLILFGSMLSIPDQGAGYSVKNGQFEASHPWFNPPPKAAKFESTGAVDQLQYDVLKPDNNKILFNQSFAAQFYIGNLADGFAFQAAYAYKPSNQISLAADGRILPGQIIDVEINPNIYFHRVYSADLQYAKGIFEVGVGALRDKPSDPEFTPEWTYRTYGESELISPYVGLRLGVVKLRAMALSVSGPSETASGPKTAELEKILQHRYSTNSAYAVEASTRFFWRRHEGLHGKVRLTEGSSSEYSAILGDLQYQLDSKWSVGGSLLLVRASQSELARKTIYSDFENNDSVQMGVMYVF